MTEDRFKGLTWLRPDTGEIVGVLPGLGDKWIVGSIKENGSTKRFRSRSIPTSDGRQKAQEMLNAYATDKGWPVCCKRCGCTDDHACEGGCSWVGDSLCSACGPTEDGRAPKRTSAGERR